MRAIVYLHNNRIYARAVSREVSGAPIVDGRCAVIDINESASDIGKVICRTAQSSRSGLPERNLKDKHVASELHREWLDASGVNTWKDFYNNSVSLLYDVREEAIYIMPSQKKGGPYRDAFIKSAEQRIPSNSPCHIIGEAILKGLKDSK